MDLPKSWKSQKCELSEENHKKWAKPAQREAINATLLAVLFGVHDLPHIALGIGHGTMGFDICPTGFWTCFDPTPFYSPIFSLWSGNIYLAPV